jgi:hypothetical protein
MKNYLAFYGAIYYPLGGMGDCIGDFDNEEDAILAIEKAHENNSIPDDAWGNVWSQRDLSYVFTVGPHLL